MSTAHRTALAKVKRFDQLIAYLRDEMGWPIARDSFEDVDDLFYNFTADELGIEPKTAAKIESIKRLRPLSPRQPWGIFFVKFEPRRLPVVVLRRILSQVALKRRASANSADRAAWAPDDLLFISNYGEGEERQISFAHFSKAPDGHDLPTLKVLGWDNLDTALHLDAVAKELTENLAWPEDEKDIDAWRERWRAAFILGHREVVTTSKELSIRLAELARAIRDRIKSALAIENERGNLTKLMKAFQEALIHDLDSDGFADMYAQTITYGLLSARIADPDKKTADDFAGHMRTNPFLRELMETFLKVGGRRGKAGGPGIDFDELGVSEVVELLDDAKMEAVVRDFGDRNPREDPVIHFYEGFAKEYDPIDKFRRGEFYTPRPVVIFIVRSVDELLRTKFGLEDGLADVTTWGEMVKRQKDLKLPDGVHKDQVFIEILDPATGTGTFLVEVIDLINKTLVEKWKAQGHGASKIEELWNEYVPKHLLTRLHAYELKMAPYAIAHMKIGLKLHETGYRFGSDERARIYLTNSLEPASDRAIEPKFAELAPALAHEANAVNAIKRDKRFTVVIGNPPYAGHSANQGEWIQRLTDEYFQIDGERLSESNLKWLRDDYVKFIRLAQQLLRESSAGIVGLITNHGYIDNPTFRGLRVSLLGDLPCLSVMDLHGNLKKKDQAADGSIDENVFDIQQGVAILLGARQPHFDTVLRHCDVLGTRESKYSLLANGEGKLFNWRPVHPAPPFFLLKPQNDQNRAEFESGVALTVQAEASLGILTKRDSLVVGFTAAEVLAKMEEFVDGRHTDAKVAQLFGLPLADKDKWHLASARKKSKPVDPAKIRPLLYRPFDTRFVYYDEVVVARTNRRVLRHLDALPGNVGLVLGRQGMATGAGVWDVCFVCSSLVDQNVYRRGGGTVFPLWLVADEQRLDAGDLVPNLPQPILRFAERSDAKPEDIFNYAYAMFYSPTYRSHYAEFLKIDFPRLPLPAGNELLWRLVPLGRQLVALHLMKTPVRDLALPTYTGPRNPEVGRVGWADGRVGLDVEATSKSELATVGEGGFQGVSEAVWAFHVGGYQVCEKWLKDRKGRRLLKSDLTHYQKLVASVSRTIGLMQEIDDVIDACGGWPGAFCASID